MRFYLYILSLFLVSGCANIVAPSGGVKDMAPPKLIDLKIENTGKHHIISFMFDEYIQFANWQNNFFISPPLSNPVEKKINKKTLTIIINESIQKDKKYYINLNNCIKDFNEGNIMLELDHSFSINKSHDTLSLQGNVKDAYNTKPLNGVWVMIFEDAANDSSIFYSKPEYISKTNDLGEFHFPNLSYANYKICALSGDDLYYHDGDKIAFINNLINPIYDSLILLNLFEPNIKTEDSLLLDDTNTIDHKNNGTISINSNQNTPALFELIKNDRIINYYYFTEPPFILKNIPADTYTIKYTYDKNNDKRWTTGSWENRRQPEKTEIYDNITVKPNWDIKLDWFNN